MCIPSAPTGREIHAGSSRRNLPVGDQRATVQIGVRHDTPVRIEIPFESERIEGYTVRRAARLKHPEYGHRVHGVFKFPPQKSRGQAGLSAPAIAPAHRPHSGVRRDNLSHRVRRRSITPARVRLFPVPLRMNARRANTAKQSQRQEPHEKRLHEFGSPHWALEVTTTGSYNERYKNATDLTNA